MIELMQELTKTCSDTKKAIKKLTAPAEDGIDTSEYLIREKNEITEEKRKREERKIIKLQ